MVFVLTKCDLAERIAETLTRCRRANELLESEFCNGAAACIQETDAAMQEYSNVKANRYDHM